MARNERKRATGSVTTTSAVAALIAVGCLVVGCFVVGGEVGARLGFLGALLSLAFALWRE